MTTYHHGNLRTALLRAAGERLEKQGITALSLREAARRVGVSHNAPYRHFADREALLAALAAQGFEMLGQPMPRPVWPRMAWRSEEHTSELQSRSDLVCRLLLEKKKTHQCTT